MIVTKFGGSSLSNKDQFVKVKNIINSNPERKVVVVSAPGKRNKDDTKITDILYTLSSHLKYNVPDGILWNSIKERYIDIKNELGISFDIEGELNNIESKFSKNLDQNYLVSRGEFLCAKLVAAYLGFEFVDAADIIKFAFDGKLDSEATENAIKTIYKGKSNIVVPGFYGSYPNGDINLFSRGGSDITGSYLTSGLNAEIYENWTDISGICTVDPRLVKNPKFIDEITYDELRELSYMGANVLHEESILPVQEYGISINIKNTNSPEDKGTIITQNAKNSGIITGIAGKKGFLSFSIKKKNMSGETGFLRKVLSIFEKYDVNVEHTPTGMDMLSVIVFEESVANKMHLIISEIENSLNAKVTIEKDISLIAFVGRNMYGQFGICASIFEILGKNGINVKTIAQAPDELTLVIGIDNSNHDTAIRVLYEGLCEKGIL